MGIDLTKIKPITFITAILFAIATICSGILFIYVFNKELFITIETLKLLLLSISISTPIWFLNTYYISNFGNEEDFKDEIESFHVYAIVGSILSIPVLYLPILVKLFCDVDLKTGVIISIIMEIINLVMTKLLVNTKPKPNK